MDNNHAKLEAVYISIFTLRLDPGLLVQCDESRDLASLLGGHFVHLGEEAEQWQEDVVRRHPSMAAALLRRAWWDSSRYA